VVKLRRTRPEDLGFVTGLERRPDHATAIGQWTDVEHLAAIQSPKREHWIIESDGVPAGYLIAFDARAEGAGIYLKRLLIAEKDKGIGTLALAKYLDHAFGDLGARFTWLTVREGNARAQAVYRRLGFHRLEAAPELDRRLSTAAEAPAAGAFRMLLKASDWDLPGASLQP
jgi:ribosomal protein S18 acetylase RimI-like enzyme